MTETQDRARQILLVEDNPDDELLMRDAFRRCGLLAEISVASDGAEALDILLQKEGGAGGYMPQLVLLDLKLPKVGGLEVIRRLRADERTRFLPVVVLSSSSERDDIRNSYKNGANAYVRKPIDFEQFLDVVRCLEMFWLQFNETA